MVGEGRGGRGAAQEGGRDPSWDSGSPFCSHSCFSYGNAAAASHGSWWESPSGSSTPQKHQNTYKYWNGFKNMWSVRPAATRVWTRRSGKNKGHKYLRRGFHIDGEGRVLPSIPGSWVHHKPSSRSDRTSSAFPIHFSSFSAAGSSSPIPAG